LDFPSSYTVKTYDLKSLFAGKCHALLCRDYIKGRDWYDFSWYIARRTPINFTFFNHAIVQTGRWKDHKMSVDAKWLIHELEEKINNMDWNIAKQDVVKFLRPRELAPLDLWSTDFFLSRLEKMAEYLP
jgi:hypothetical protein